MIVNLDLEKGTCVMIREEGDPRFSGRINAAGESRLLYHVKLALIAQGHDVIKKRMWKDGHLVDNLQQYIRTRQGYKPSFCIYNNRWAIRGAEKYLNEFGQVRLAVETNIWSNE